MDNPDIDAIICVRGGYGTVRIVDRLDFSKFVQNPKWIVGYSDVTVLHAKLQSLGIESLHATMPINFQTNTQQSLDTLFDAYSTTEADIVSLNTKYFNHDTRITNLEDKLASA